MLAWLTGLCQWEHLGLRNGAANITWVGAWGSPLVSFAGFSSLPFTLHEANPLSPPCQVSLSFT